MADRCAPPDHPTQAEPMPHDPQTVAQLLADHWALHAAEVTLLEGGMNSLTWEARSGGTRWVVKVVPPEAEDAFVFGLGLAKRLERDGIPAGAPVATTRGRSIVPFGGQVMALLRWVEGRGLTGESHTELGVMGSTLARAHHALGTQDGKGTGPTRLYLPSEHLDVRPWLRPVITNVMARLDPLDLRSLTWGPVHGDPAPDVFRLDPVSGVCGMIDWSGAGVLPRVYDLAALVMYRGPDSMRPLIDAYVAGGALTHEEVERALHPLLDYRWAGQAAYFAGRIARGDLTGIDGPQVNEAGLEAARQWFAARGDDHSGR
ncbi:phosphotransferase enzyme family protein [Streptomyces sp. VTCC 41912]|uniref:phosphotransferase enzyme family protein n=1 Tax=Streptomyces sp. VTCC 41912 TaxID=3383243 RepID=UPI003896DC1C